LSTQILDTQRVQRFFLPQSKLYWSRIPRPCNLINGFIMWIFITGIIILLVFLIELSLFAGAFSISPFSATRKTDLDRINRLAALKPGQLFYDIGSGDGRIGTPKGFARLKPKFNEMKNGSKILVYSSKIPGMEPNEISQPKGKHVGINFYFK